MTAITIKQFINTMNTMTTRALLVSYRKILHLLFTRGKIVRTKNAPTGDFAEYLVAEALGGQLMDNSTKGYDIEVPASHPGETVVRVQVKSRIVTGSGKGERRLSKLSDGTFDELVIVLFDDEYNVTRAVKLDGETAKRQANGEVLVANEDVLDKSTGQDITDALRDVLNAMS